ncbi:MAG: type II toxin-antitoxin system PemK/MazF family toxin [Ancalomicrobiaceae bacterium]|nr:type II toxin-antitoxin system PemK/MazF family toxin [Ancalomicrobiaceae bacterium]
MKRGDLIITSLPGDYGKPRPALMIQSDLFAETESLTVLPLTSMLVTTPLGRVTVDPDPQNGLRARSQVMIDKLMTIRRDKVGPVIGSLDTTTMLEVNRLLALFLGLG